MKIPISVVLGVGLFLLGLMIGAAAPCQASEQDIQLTVMARSDTSVALGIKRYISIYDCRRDRDWLFTVLSRANAEPVFITCAPMEVMYE